jgi:hypothetical protein
VIVMAGRTAGAAIDIEAVEVRKGEIVPFVDSALLVRSSELEL